MGFIEDAQKFMQTHPPATPKTRSLQTSDECETLKKDLKTLYENATNSEIERAIEAAKERFGNTPLEQELMTFLRIKLED